MPHTILKTRGIVLRTRRMGDTSRLVTIYTESAGKLSVKAKGARRLKSKFGSSLEMMAEVSAICYVRENRGLQTLTECELLQPPPIFNDDLIRFCLASAALELVNGVTIEGESNDRIYQYLRGVLEGLQEVDGDRVESLFWYFELRLLDALGYRPELRQCAVCSDVISGEYLWFSPSLGGSVCMSCSSEGHMRVTYESLKFLGDLQQLHSYRRNNLPISFVQRKDINKILNSFYNYHCTGQGSLRSLKILESVDNDIPQIALDKLDQSRSRSKRPVYYEGSR